MTKGEKLIRLLGLYTSHSGGSDKALYHERMERAVADLGIEPIEFEHPNDKAILAEFDMASDRWTNLILSGEAGVGKTRVVHKLVREVLKDQSRLKSKGAYWKQEGISAVGTRYTAYINRDLSASRLFGAEDPAAIERPRLELWSKLMLGQLPQTEFFIIAANDGQLLDAWKDYADVPEVGQALRLLEKCIQEGKTPDGVPMRFFHLASLRTDIIFELCLDAFLAHPGWQSLLQEHSGEQDIFSEPSPLRRNWEGLKDPIVRRRLLDLALLCHSNDWHLPVRNILVMLANTILGCSNDKIAPSGIMDIEGARLLMAEGKTHDSNLFANILGLNLPPEYREKFLGPIESFRVGLEALNQSDSLILFGPDDEDDLKNEHAKLFLNDPAFPPDSVFEQYRLEYINSGPRSPDGEESPFYDQLIAQRRRLFFRTPDEMEMLYDPWGLTNFHHAKEYLSQLLRPSLIEKKTPHQRLLGPLLVGLNRIWTNLLLDDQDHLFITTSLDYATAGASDIEVRRIPAKSITSGEFPYVHLTLPSIATLTTKLPEIAVHLKEGYPPITLPLTLTRFEFLKRVAGGALPSSFSRECSEDIRSFKSRVLAKCPATLTSSLRLLRVNADGKADIFALRLDQE